MPDPQQDILDAAAAILGADPNEITVVLVRGEIAVVPEPTARPSAPVPTLSPYDAAIVAAATQRPRSAEQLAAAAGHRFNSHFRKRLARLVEAGHLRHTRRGYNLPNSR